MPRSLHRLCLAGAALAAFILAGMPGSVHADTYTDIQTRMDSGQIREAAEEAAKVTAANPADCQAWKLLGDAQTRLARVDQAARSYREGLKACADDKPLLKALGMLLDETEQYDEAVRVLDRLWTLDSSDPVIGSRLGAAAYRAGRCAEGRRAFESLLKAHPDRLTDRIAYAQLLGRSCRDYAAAEAEYRIILGQRANDPAIHCALSYLQSSAGRVEDAVKTAENGISAAPGNAGCLYAAWGRALEVAGDSLMIKGSVEEARNYYRQAMDPLSKGTTDPVFGDYCKAILAEVKYKESPMEELAP
jgi:Flp pilus assembly protein TadD